MGEAERNKATIKGVIVPDAGMNIQAYKDALINEYENTSDQYGKTKTVEFSEEIKTDTDHYINYWVY